jgi:predicted small lipoprotein YifL
MHGHDLALKDKGTRKMVKKCVITCLVTLLAIAGLTACGKRGDPYRPSDVSAKTETVTE